MYRQNKSDASTANDKDFPLAPLEDLGFMALGEGRWLPLSLEWLETFFIAVSGGLMVLLWLSRVFLNLRNGGPKVAWCGGTWRVVDWSGERSVTRLSLISHNSHNPPTRCPSSSSSGRWPW